MGVMHRLFGHKWKTVGTMINTKTRDKITIKQCKRCGVIAESKRETL